MGALLPPRIAGRYLVEEEVGRGGMSLVYRGFDRDLRRHLAIKQVLSGLGADRDLAGEWNPVSKATSPGDKGD